MNSVTNCPKCDGTGRTHVSYFHPTHAGGPTERITETYCDCPQGSLRRAHDTCTVSHDTHGPICTSVASSSKAEAKRKRKQERKRLGWVHR